MFSNHLIGFFGAVNAFRETGGRGDFSIHKTAPGSYDIIGSYCNYECRDCVSRLYAGRYLIEYPALKILPGDGDAIHYELRDYHDETSPEIMARMAIQTAQSIPNIDVRITARQEDFFRFEFTTM